MGEERHRNRGGTLCGKATFYMFFFEPWSIHIWRPRFHQSSSFIREEIRDHGQDSGEGRVFRFVKSE